jgi:hypothetical protein
MMAEMKHTRLLPLAGALLAEVPTTIRKKVRYALTLASPSRKRNSRARRPRPAYPELGYGEAMVLPRPECGFSRSFFFDPRKGVTDHIFQSFVFHRALPIGRR